MASRHFSFKTGKAGRGAKHAEYIAGQGKYLEREDVRYMADRNLPGWAKDGRDFFDAADKLERANGRAYSEVEFAIPRECADPVAYAEQYAERLLGDRHTYRLAVHDKLAADGGRNVHGHLMFSERRLDGIERDRDQFFRRANSKHPERGGTAKDRQWNDRKHIDTLRRGYEAHAQANGIALDLRSNLAQGLAQAEPKIGPQRKRSTPDHHREERAASVKRLRTVRRETAQVRAELTTLEKEQRNELTRQRRARARQHQQAAGLSEVSQLRGLDSVSHVAERPEMLLQPDEPDHLEQPEARQDHRLVHELDAKRAAEPAKLTGPTPEQWAQTAKALEAGSQAAKQQAERQAAIKATADQERQEQRPKRHRAWQTKHILRSPSIAPRTTPPAPGKPNYWTYQDGPAKGKACVVDYGDRIKPAGKLDKISDTKIAALLDVAKVKGWPALTITGPQDFRLRVAEAAQARGMPLADRDLVQALAQRQAEATRKAAEASQRAAEAAQQRQAQEAARKAAEASQRAAEQQERMKAQMVKTITPSEPLSPAKPQQPPPTLKALKEELGKLQNEARLDLGSQIRKLQPEAYSEAQAQADAKALAVAQINDEAKRNGNAQALPANQYEYDHTHGWGRQVAGAEHLLAEHQKTPKPFFGKAKAEWTAKEQTLSENLKAWKAAVRERDLKLITLTAEKLRQVKVDHAKREAEKPAKLAQVQDRLKAVQERIGSIEKTLQEPHYVKEAQQQKERMQGQGRGR